MTKTATFLRSVNPEARGAQRLYKLDPPLKYTEGWGENEKKLAADYVVVSAAVVPYSGAETYIFPADSDGNVTGWGELDGSYRGGLSHDEALRNAGYETA